MEIRSCDRPSSIVMDIPDAMPEKAKPAPIPEPPLVIARLNSDDQMPSYDLFERENGVSRQTGWVSYDPFDLYNRLPSEMKAKTVLFAIGSFRSEGVEIPELRFNAGEWKVRLAHRHLWETAWRQVEDRRKRKAQEDGLKTALILLLDQWGVPADKEQATVQIKGFELDAYGSTARVTVDGITFEYREVDQSSLFIIDAELPMGGTDKPRKLCGPLDLMAYLAELAEDGKL